MLPSAHNSHTLHLSFVTAGGKLVCYTREKTACLAHTKHCPSAVILSDTLKGYPPDLSGPLVHKASTAQARNFMADFATYMGSPARMCLQAVCITDSQASFKALSMR